MDVAAFLWLGGGLAILVFGAEALVRGASGLAAKTGISPHVIGLTVVAFGTSSPELAVSIQAAASGQAELSVGNVIGSNIFNIVFILGLSAIITPLIVSQQLIKLDVPIMIGASVLVLLLSIDGKISRLQGGLLFGCMMCYLWFLIWQSRREEKFAGQHAVEGDSPPGRSRSWFTNLALVVTGLVMLVFGSNGLVTGATALATAMGVSNLIVGLTIVAAGTSLPEVATSVVASIRGARDIAVGNVVGSNIFNILVVLGSAAIAAPSGLPISDAVLRFDMPFMIAIAIACLPIFLTGNLISRWEGALFLGYYIAYTTYLILGATHHEMLPVFSLVMQIFVIPVTVISLATVLVRSILSRRRTAKYPME